MKKVKRIIEKINKISKTGKKIQMKKMIENNHQLMKAAVKLLNNLKESNKRK